MYVYVVRSDVAVKRVFYGDNNSDINVYIRELILSNKDRNLQILLTTRPYVDGQTACSTSKSTISYPLEDRKGVAPLSQVYQTCNTATHEVFRRFGFAYAF